jgi:selenide,water dikinase
LADKTAIDRSVGPGLVEVALDPQTSGGLLVAVPKKRAAALVSALQRRGVSAATIVGHATALGDVAVRLV